MVTTPSRTNSRGREKKSIRKSRPARTIALETAREAARDLALQRLLALLEAESLHEQPNHSLTVHNSADSLSRLSRLRAARATYALATMPNMERVTNGAWLRRQDAEIAR